MSIPRILLEDRAEITELIAEYAYRYDENRITDFVELFLADAELSFYVASGDEPFLTTSSNAERMVTLREIKSSPNRQAGQARHIQTNTVLEHLSNGRISGRTFLVCTLQPVDGSPNKILFTGVYRDEFQRTDAGWRFAIRKAYLDIPDLE